MYDLLIAFSKFLTEKDMYILDNSLSQWVFHVRSSYKSFGYFVYFCGQNKGPWYRATVLQLDLTLGLLAHTQNFINFSIIRNISNYGGIYQDLGVFGSPC